MPSSDLCWRPHWAAISTERKTFSQKQVSRPLARGRGRISTSISTRIAEEPPFFFPLDNFQEPLREPSLTGSKGRVYGT